MILDASNLEIDGYLVNNSIKECSSDTALKIYDSIFSIFENIKKSNVLIAINQEIKYIEIILKIENNANNILKKELLEKCEEIIDIKEKQIENTTKISYKISI